MKDLSETPAWDRPREKLYEKGAPALDDGELIAVLLGSGTQGRGVLQVASDVAALLRAKTGVVALSDLVSIQGVGRAKAAQILAGLELSRRYREVDPGGRMRVRSPGDILPLVASYSRKSQEHFIAITLNGAGEVIESRVITVGLLNHSLVHPREVFADAIADRAASLICVHNHPSGSLDASAQDIAITGQLKNAGEILGIRLLDHLIISSHGFVSMKELGYL